MKHLSYVAVITVFLATTSFASAQTTLPTPETTVPQATVTTSPPSTQTSEPAGSGSSPQKPTFTEQTSSAKKVRTERRQGMVLIGGGIGFGFFYPKEVNNYISKWYDSLNATTTSGFNDIILNITPRLAVNVAFVEYLQLQIYGEIAWGPKIMAVAGGESKFFNYNRYTAGGTLNAHIPLGRFTKSLFFGAGASYNKLGFEKYDSAGLGLRGQAGFRFYMKRFVPEVFIAFDWVKGNSQKFEEQEVVFDPADGSQTSVSTIDQMELNYTSLIIGGNFYFGAKL